MVEGLVEVKQLGAGQLSHLFDGLLDLAVVQFCTGKEAGMGVADGRHAGHQDARLGIGASEAVDEREIILHEVFAVERPVARVGVIDTQVDHHDIARKIHGLPEFLLLHIGPMPLPQQRGPGLPEIAHQIVLAQHTLKLHRVGLLFPVFQH